MFERNVPAGRVLRSEGGHHGAPEAEAGGAIECLAS